MDVLAQIPYIFPQHAGNDLKHAAALKAEGHAAIDSPQKSDDPGDLAAGRCVCFQTWLLHRELHTAKRRQHVKGRVDKYVDDYSLHAC